MSSIWSKLINLAGNVTGTLAVAHGGTGVTTSTGSGSVVLSTSPTLVTPALGTPASGTLTNCTGYPVVVPGTSAGLVSASGVPGNTTGSAIAAGFVGEKIETTQSLVSTGAVSSAAYWDSVSVNVTAGVWSLNYLIAYNLNGATATEVGGAIGTASGSSTSGITEGQTAAFSPQPTANYDTHVSIPGVIVSVGSNTTYYGKGWVTYSAGTLKYAARLTAVRIA